MTAASAYLAALIGEEQRGQLSRFNLGLAQLHLRGVTAIHAEDLEGGCRLYWLPNRQSPPME